MAKTQEVAVVPKSDFLILQNPDMADTLAEALQSSGVSQFDLPRLKVPSGGGLAWELETLEGVDVKKEVDVVLGVIRTGQRAWWKVPVGQGEASPPSCRSHDGVTGFGVNTLEEGATDETHDCRTCPWSQWGSSRSRADSRAKDCTEKAFVMCFSKGSALPMLLSVPPTSLKALKAYQLKLIGACRPMTAVVTRLSLRRESGANDYSVIEFGFAGMLDDDAAAEMKSLGESLKVAFDSVISAID